MSDSLLLTDLQASIAEYQKNIALLEEELSAVLEQYREEQKKKEVDDIKARLLKHHD